MRRVLFTENRSPCFLTHFLYFSVAGAVAIGGYQIGKDYVADNYYMGDPLDFLMGGYPGAVAFFGLTSQFFVDIARLRPAQQLNDRLKQLEKRMLSFCISADQEPLHEDLLQNFDGLFVEWDASWGALFTFLGLRLMHYSVAGALGVSAIGYPMKVTYGGGDIYQKSEQRLSLFLAFLLIGFQVGLAISAYRSDQSSGVTFSQKSIRSQRFFCCSGSAGVSPQLPLQDSNSVCINFSESASPLRPKMVD